MSPGKDTTFRVLQIVGQFAKIDRWLVARGVLEEVKPSETDAQLQEKSYSNTDTEVRPRVPAAPTSAARGSAFVLLTPDVSLEARVHLKKLTACPVQSNSCEQLSPSDCADE